MLTGSRQHFFPFFFSGIKILVYLIIHGILDLVKYGSINAVLSSLKKILTFIHIMTFSIGLKITNHSLFN